MPVALVPVKRLDKALRRLGNLLTQKEKRQLSLSMLTDVLAAMGQTRKLDGTVLVSREPLAWELARFYNARIIEEPENIIGEGPAVDHASRSLAREGIDRTIVIPSDLPLVKPEEIDILLGQKMPRPSVVMAPSADGGTNALLCTPPGCIPSRFGPDSLSLHIEEAESRGIPYKVVQLPSFWTDIDSPEDLASFLNIASNTHTLHIMRQMGVHTRLVQGIRPTHAC